MRTPLTWIEKVVGLFVVLILALFAAALFYTAQRHRLFQLKRPFEVFANYDKGYGLKVGAPVVINDVDGGVVTDVKLVRAERVQVVNEEQKKLGTLVRVTIRVEDDFAEFLGYRTKANVVRPPIGSSSIELLSEGPPGSLRLGATIESMVEESLFEKLAKVRDDIFAVREQILRTLQDLQKIIENVRITTDALARGEGTIGRAIEDPAMSEDVAASIREARAMIEHLRAVAENANGASGRIPAISREAQGLVEDARAAVRKVDASLAELPAIVSSLERVLAEVEKIAANFREASGGAPELVRKADRGLLEANRLIQAAQKNFLIRGGLPERRPPESGAEIPPRGGSR